MLKKIGFAAIAALMAIGTLSITEAASGDTENLCCNGRYCYNQSNQSDDNGNYCGGYCGGSNRSCW